MAARVVRLNSLVDGILAYSRAGRSKEELILVDLNSLIRNAIDLLWLTRLLESKMTLESILLLDDDDIDAMCVRRALKASNSNCTLDCAENGEKGLEYLHDPVNKRPDLILLDINMPRMNGIEFLEHVKNDPVLRLIPVVMLTTSRMDIDRFNAFSLSIAGYMTKPVDYDQFVAIVNAIICSSSDPI